MRDGTRLTVLFAALVVGLPAPSEAGECLGLPAEIVQQLQRAVEKGGFDRYAAHCLGLYRFGAGNRWAGPRAARTFARLRRSPQRRRIARICSTVLSRKDREASRQCVRLLCDYGVRKLGDRPTIELVQRYYPGGMDPRSLAALSDRRAVPLLIKRFAGVRPCSEQADRTTSGGESGRPLARLCIDPRRPKLNAWSHKRYVERKVALLNALWHLADPRARPFLKLVAGSDPDALVRKRARRSLERLNQQHPPARKDSKAR